MDLPARYELLNQTALLLAGSQFVLWAVIGFLAGRLRAQPAAARRGTARDLLVLLGFGGLVLLAHVIVVAAVWSIEWELAGDHVLVALPLLLAPMVGVAVLTVPLAVGLARDRDVGPIGPWPVVAVQATAVGAMLGWYAGTLVRPIAPYADELALYGALLAIATAVLWLRQRVLPDGMVPARPLWSGLLRTVGALVAVALLGVALHAYGSWSTRLPDRISMSGHDPAQHGGHRIAEVSQLTGAVDGVPDRVFTLTAQDTKIRLSSGAIVAAGLTFNGQAPGPELRVRQGELVQVTLVNRTTKDGVTLHWHGLNVPNAQDGAAGLTQDAVPPGGSYVYRFRPAQIGTFWYHSHQTSAREVTLGLFGALVVLPPDGEQAEFDRVVLKHIWPVKFQGRSALGVADGTVERAVVAPGTRVRLRLVNTNSNVDPTTDDRPATFTVNGTPFRIVAIDGADLVGPTDLVDARLGIAAGGRYDIEFAMPDRPVRLTEEANPVAGFALLPHPDAPVPGPRFDGPAFDPLSYGVPAPVPFDRSSHFDVDYKMVLDDRLGFYDGTLQLVSLINGQSYPDVPSPTVRQGDLVRLRVVNRGREDHPIHLHGHRALVLSRNGQPSQGSPWWTDTIEVRPGEAFDLAFRADNPGIWMAHCHNLEHAKLGMMGHFVYEGVTSPHISGRETGNYPE
ncbi:multicopper oxidase family protein [Actinokineospora iranica]|uniref:Multicopper oxidase with three cupredoxin domains (Includes cell division protein FtsP and spore coat protein CotA) n=1 Tax=Actinokineospora iranica TaxID=1271860 RepID=A0A1G6KP64_9PSEU|nr:multicopper oxidase family protein [Actinokineospora iranica]SDC32869.1 Multicopper oxidase with three cupredoxin domains (includes cell division protein FtsP and spore coat protein CotA) [Actinokineospora iranica]